jgi:hypothetical protein
MPLAFILIGEMFTLEQRAKMQGLFSGVWGVSSIMRPAAGRLPRGPAFLALDLLHQHLPGLLAAALVTFAWRDQAHGHGRPVVDYAGAALLMAASSHCCSGLMDPERPTAGC